MSALVAMVGLWCLLLCGAVALEPYAVRILRPLVLLIIGALVRARIID